MNCGKMKCACNPALAPRRNQLVGLDDLEVPDNYNNFDHLYNYTPYNDNVGVRQLASVPNTDHTVSRLDQVIPNIIPSDKLPIIRKTQMLEGFGIFGMDVNTHTIIRIIAVVFILCLIYLSMVNSTPPLFFLNF
jgi:hypothetical protein